MPSQTDLHALRLAIRNRTLTAEADLAPQLLEAVDMAPARRKVAQDRAAEFVRDARSNASRSGLIDKFLQEYGLSTAEGVTLMRLAEALLRTPDAATADALIEDKIEAGDWGAHVGKSPFPLVNFSTRALMLTAAWLDDVEAKDPARKLVAATKGLLDRVGEPVIRASVAQAMRIMGEHFVLGETIEEAGKRGREYAERGYLFSYDMLGEAAHTAADAEKYFTDYETAIAAISRNAKHENPADNPGISVKLSALHPRYEYGKKERVMKELGASIRALALQAKNANIGFNIDAEEAARLDLSLDLIEALMFDPALQDWSGLGVVVQAYQRRAMPVIDWLAAAARKAERRIMVRLVKGAYWDSEIKRAQVMGLESYPVFTRKVLTDLSYLACARNLLANTDVFYPQFATHNALTAAMVREMAGDYADYELQRLHGMGDALHDNLIEKGARSRIYAPVGGHKELLPYLVRRLLENGANSSFVNQLIDPDLSVDDIVADPVDETVELNVIANPSIPAPRDLFSGRRLSAKGFDDTDPQTAESLHKAVSAPIDNDAKITALPEGGDPRGVGEADKNPAHEDEEIARIWPADAHAVDRACKSAKSAAPSWAAAPAADRAKILRQAADLLEGRSERFMQLATREAGKTIPDAIAEVREAVDFLRYYADEATGLKGEPLGVVACISPWNFPLAIFLGQVSAALAAGNTVIAKPAEQTPFIAFEAIRLLYEAGVPDDALHFLPGDGPGVGAPLVAHPDIAGVVFTGSTAVAQAINKSLCESGKHDATLIAETGGINVMIVDSTALLEQAVTDTISSAFQSAGQRCSACRIVAVQEDIADRFNEMLAGAMAELRVGDPSLLKTDVGPVIDEEALRSIESHVTKMRKTAKIVAEAPEISDDVNGTFLRPIAFEISHIGDLEREVFGPALHVVRFKSKHLDKLVDDINALGYGLTMGVHTRIDETMHKIANGARVGNIYVNRNQIGAVVGVQPFGGEGLSGTGPKAGGPHYLEALQKRPVHISEKKSGLSISGRAFEPSDKAIVERAENAFNVWRRMDIDRGALFERAAANGSAEGGPPLRLAKEVYVEHFAQPTELPGPTGESNTLRLRARGVVLCLGGGDYAHLERQIGLSLAAGNAVVTLERIAADVAAKLKAVGAPADLVTGFGGGRDIHINVLQQDAVRAVVFDGDLATRKTILTHLAARTGPIIPLLTTRDAPWRFAVERTRTINTTAAGGDVRLLSLGD